MNDSRESTPEEVMALFFLVLVLVAMAFFLLKPHFSYLQLYISLKEARLFVTLGDRFADTGFLHGELREYCLAALQYANQYGVASVNVKFDGPFPYYIMIDKEGYINDIPERLYQSFYWFNYSIATIPVALMMISLYRMYAVKIERYNIKKLGYKQTILYEEIGINERSCNKDEANKNGVFNVMDYLIPNVDKSKVDRYVEDSVRISLKSYNPNFVKLGEKKSREFMKFVKTKLEALRLEAAKYWRDILASDELFKYIGGDHTKLIALIKEYEDDKSVSFSEFIGEKLGGGKYEYSGEKQTKFEYWLRAEISDFLLDAYYYLNMIALPHSDSVENRYKITIDFDNKINSIRIVYSELGYDKTKQQRAYLADRDNISNILEKERALNGGVPGYDDDARRVYLEKSVEDRYSDHLRIERENSHENGEGLRDYILYSKFYRMKAKRNGKKEPIPLPARDEIVRILSEGTNTEKEELEKKFASYYYPDDKLEQYGRIIPLPVYIMTPIRSTTVTEQVRFKKIKADGKSEYTFLAEGANVFLEIIIERILFSFEKAVKKTIAEMKKDANGKDVKDEDKETLTKLQEEIGKMLETGEKDARRTQIDRLLEIHRFEETFLMGLLKYARTLLNMPVGTIGAKVKRTNPALWYAMTGVGRTYTYNVSYPIQAMYEFEVRQSYKLAKIKSEEAVKKANVEENQESSGGAYTSDGDPEPELPDIESSADYSYDDKEEVDPETLPRRANADREDYMGPVQRIPSGSSTTNNMDFVNGNRLYGYR